MNLMHEFRKDPILDRWIIVAKTAVTSPADYIVKKEDEADDSHSCPLCAGKEGNTPPEITAIRAPGSKPDGPGWFTRVTHLFKPLLQVDGKLNPRAVGIYDMIDGVGASELIIESPEHSSDKGMNIEQTVRVFLTYKERIMALESDKRLKYVLISKNYGKAAGAEFSHPHSQLIASPIIPKRIKEELDGARLYYRLKDRCVFCDIIREEEKIADRIILENRNFIVFCPFAPAFPFEAWIVPRRHNCAFQDIEEEEMEGLGATVISLMDKMKKLLDDPPYNLILHTAPNRVPRRGHWHTLEDDFHWHIEVVPRLISPGFEWRLGFYVLNIPPEEGAKYLREV